MTENVTCDQSQGIESLPLLVVGVALTGVGILTFVGIDVVSETTGSWAFAIGLAMSLRGYSGGCLSGLIPGVKQCNVETETAENR